MKSTTWAAQGGGDGVPESRYAQTPLLRMRQHHQYERAVREERLLERLAQIVYEVAKDFRTR
jgi:hypothetical protein